MKLAIALLALAISATAQTYKFSVLHPFRTGSDGNEPMGTIVLDQAGNLWGTTQGGGSYELGILWELEAQTHKEVIKRFNSHNGSHPEAGIAGSGIYYGTTQTGVGDKCNCGTVFQVVNGVQSAVYVFKNGADGEWPNQGIQVDGAGNLYGVSTGGLFEITGGKLQMLYTSGVGSFAVDANGNIFFIDGSEALEELGVGVLYQFPENSAPTGIAVSTDGLTVTGITQSGGQGWGSVWEWSQQTGETDLYDFPPSDDDLDSPETPVTFDGNGNAFGVIQMSGPAHKTFGAVYEVQLGMSNPPTVLHQFSGMNDGYWPEGPVILDANGNIYGTASAGGKYLRGTVFELAVVQ